MAYDDPSLELIWAAFTGYQRTAAVKAAIELDVFTAIAEGVTTVDALARRCGAAPRGMRALVNHLAMDGFLTRTGDTYGLSATAAAFLDRNGPAWVGSAMDFIASAHVREGFDRLTDAVRRGGSALPEGGSVAPEHPMWVTFARAMAPLAAMSARLLASLLDVEHAPAWKVLDVAAGHGLYGITLASANPGIQVTALDWKNVLSVAAANARQAGVSARYRLLPGSAFEVDLGGPYDLVLLPNILHHFDEPTCERLLARVHAALAPAGRAVLVEFVPDADRTGPPDAVRFALVMLAGTPAGDAYTFPEYQAMLRKVGFSGATLHDLVPSPGRAVIATR